MPCAGNPSATCGGSNALSLVYDTTKLNADLSPKSGSGSTGGSTGGSGSTAALPAGFASASSSLIAEGSSGRALISASTSSAGNTPASCAAYCSNLGFGISGTEYSSEW
jgi:hypothetical protein